MKLRIFFAVVLVAVAWVAGRAFMNGGGGAAAGEAAAVATAGAAGGSERVVNETFKVAPFARVDVSGVNGPVEVIVVEGDVASVRVVSESDDARALEKQKLTVRQTEDGGIVVRGGDDKRGHFWGWLVGRPSRVSQRVELRVPRRVELRAGGINGKVSVGEIEGAIKLSGVNGPVEVARAAGRAELSGIHGPVSVGIAALAGDGVRISGVHGPVELKLTAGANADVSASGLNGPVHVNDSRVTVEEESPVRFSGRVGAGGAPVRVSGIHGSLTLARG